MFCLFLCRMITLKVLNSIVLLGKSCHYVKDANMEGKLFDKPKTPAPKKSPTTPSQTKSPPPAGNTWLHLTTCHDYCSLIALTSSILLWNTSLRCCVFPILCSLYFFFSLYLFSDKPEAQHPTPTITSITKQPVPRTPELLPPAPNPVTMETSEPAPESPCKAEQENGKSSHGTELKHRTPKDKKDLLEIDRFTLCGNRIL